MIKRIKVEINPIVNVAPSFKDPNPIAEFKQQHIISAELSTPLSINIGFS